MSPNEVIRPRWSHLEYKWRLDHFWQLRALACAEALEDEGGGLVWSQKFGDKERGFWQLKLYPYGDASPAGRGHVSLFLALDLKSLDAAKAYAIFGCYLLDEKGEKVAGSGRSFTRQKFAEGSNSWGWSQFIKVEGPSLNKLLSATSNSLVVKCDIDVFTGTSAAPARKLPPIPLWNDEIKAVMANPMYHDVRIHLAENAGIRRGNRVALIARSKFFADHLSPLKHTKSIQDVNVLNQTSISASNSRQMNETHGLANGKENVMLMSSASPFSPSPQPHYASFGGLIENPSNTDLTPTPKYATTSAPSAGMVESSSSVNMGKMPITVAHHSINSIELLEQVPIEAFDNLLAFIHTDDCIYMSERTTLSKVLDLFILSKQFEVESLYNTLLRRLCGALVSKSTAIAIQRIAKKVGAEDLEDECRSFLLTCARDLSEDELLKAIVPKPN